MIVLSCLSVMGMFWPTFCQQSKQLRLLASNMSCKKELIRWIRVRYQLMLRDGLVLNNPWFSKESVAWKDRPAKNNLVHWSKYFLFRHHWMLRYLFQRNHDFSCLFRSAKIKTEKDGCCTRFHLGTGTKEILVDFDRNFNRDKIRLPKRRIRSFLKTGKKQD